MTRDGWNYGRNIKGRVFFFLQIFFNKNLYGVMLL